MRRFFRKWHRSKTQWFNGALVLTGLVQANIEEFRQLMPPSYFGIFLVAIGIVGWYLRTITTQPVEEK